LASEFDIYLKIENTRIGGWKDITVSRSLGALSGDFEFSLVDFPLEETAGIVAGEAVEIYMSDGNVQHNLITGYIDRVSRQENSNNTILKFNGRGRTSDLVDCSAVHKSNTWKKQKLSKIAEDICQPFDIFVSSFTIDDPTIDEFTLQNGETSFNAIERLCRATGILPLEDENGNLLLTTIAENKADVRLIVGQNVKEIEFTEDYSGRYSQYIFRGQRRGNGSTWVKDQQRLRGTFEDTDVLRYRPMIALAERHTTDTEIARRASWEAQVRAGRAIQCQVLHRGWFQDPDNQFSRPWTINELTEIIHDTWGIHSELVNSSVTFQLSESSGRLTKMVFSPPEIYAADPGDEIKLSRRSSVRPN
jgi:prophage tail gpP-like protein